MENTHNHDHNHDHSHGNRHNHPVEEKSHPLVHYIDFSLPKKEVDSTIQKKYSDLVKKSRIQGFRPGKVPLSVIQQRYGEEVHRETINEFAKKTIDEKLKDIRSKLASQVTYNDAPAQSADVYNYRARYEVFPEIDFQFAQCGNIKFPDVTIDDKAIGQMFDWLKLVYGQEVQADPERKIVGGDRIVIDLVMESQDKDAKGENEKLLNLSKYGFVVPIYNPDGYLDFPTKPLLGKKVADEVVWKHTYSEDFDNAVIAGREITLRAKILEVHHRTPLTDDELYVKLGLTDKTAEERTLEIRKQITIQLERRQTQTIFTRLSKALVKSHKFEVPPTILDEELMKVGKSLNIHPYLIKNSEDPKHKVIWEKMLNRATETVANGIIWLKLGEKLPEKVNNDEVLAQIKKNSEEFENSAQVYKNMIRDQQTLIKAYDEVHQNKLLNWLKTQVKIENEKVSFAEFMIG